MIDRVIEYNRKTIIGERDELDRQLAGLIQESADLICEFDSGRLIDMIYIDRVKP